MPGGATAAVKSRLVSHAAHGPDITWEWHVKHCQHQHYSRKDETDAGHADRLVWLAGPVGWSMLMAVFDGWFNDEQGYLLTVMIPSVRRLLHG